MGVELKINSRHYPGRDRHPLAADWITVSRHRRFKRGNSAKFERYNILEKIRSRYGDQRQITIVGNELHGRRIFVGIVLPLHDQIAAVGDYMCVSQNAIATYDEAGADAALERPRIPRRLVIRLH